MIKTNSWIHQEGSDKNKLLLEEGLITTTFVLKCNIYIPWNYYKLEYSLSKLKFCAFVILVTSNCAQIIVFAAVQNMLQQITETHFYKSNFLSFHPPFVIVLSVSQILYQSLWPLVFLCPYLDLDLKLQWNWTYSYFISDCLPILSFRVTAISSAIQRDIRETEMLWIETRGCYCYAKGKWIRQEKLKSRQLHLVQAINTTNFSPDS